MRDVFSRLQAPLERPLCIILSWLVSKPNHLMKYADIYLETGFDVMTVTCSPLQLLFPVRGAQVCRMRSLRLEAGV